MWRSKTSNRIITIKFKTMKKVILVLAISLGISVFFTSCRDSKKENKTEMHENQDHEANEMASNVVYQCPMDCEKGKSYTEKGNCPVCKMDLKGKEVDMDGDSDMHKDSTDHDGHDHQ